MFLQFHLMLAVGRSISNPLFYYSCTKLEHCSKNFGASMYIFNIPTKELQRNSQKIGRAHV